MKAELYLRKAEIVSFDIDYQSRQFLEFMQHAEAETVHLDNGTNGGLGKEQIQQLEKRLDTVLVADSQYLLSRALGVRAKTIAMNNTNRRLADFMKEQDAKVEELKKKDKSTKKEIEEIKYRSSSVSVGGSSTSWNNIEPCKKKGKQYWKLA